jgi:hypothetical protein
MLMGAMFHGLMPSLPSPSTFKLAFAALVVISMVTGLFFTASGSLLPFYTWFATLLWWQQAALTAIPLSLAGLALYFCLIDLLVPDRDDEEDD